MTPAEQRPERATHAEAEWDVINWEEIGRLASRFSDQLAAEGGWYGNACYGEMIRRAIAFGGSGLITEAEAKRVRDSHTVVERINRENAEAALKRVQTQLDQARAVGAAQAAETLRGWCNEHTVPSRYRREGVELAADYLTGWARRAAKEAER